MGKLMLPAYDFREALVGGRPHIWDMFRKKYVALTPEEEVRQRFALYLVKEKDYPASLIQTEYSLSLNEMHRRCDILIHKPAGRPKATLFCGRRPRKI